MTSKPIHTSLISWRGRLMALVLAAVLPLFAFIAFQAIDIRDRRVEEGLQRAFEYAKIGADGYEDTIADAKSLLELLSHVPEVVSGQSEVCLDALKVAAEPRRWVSGLWVVGEDGFVRCTTVDGGVGLDLSAREDYRRGVASPGFSLSDAI